MTHGPILYLDDVSVSFDGLKAPTSCAYHRGRQLRYHRAQRRRQDDDDGRDHRQDPARSGTVFFGQSIDLTPIDRTGNRPPDRSQVQKRVERTRLRTSSSR